MSVMLNVGLCAGSLILSFIAGAFADADKEDGFLVKTIKLILGITSILAGMYYFAILELLFIGGETLEIGPLHAFVLFIAGVGLSWSALTVGDCLKNKAKKVLGGSHG